MALATGDISGSGPSARRGDGGAAARRTVVSIADPVCARHSGGAAEATPTKRLRWCAKASLSIRELHDKFAFVYALVPLARRGGSERRRRLGGADSRARDAVTERTGATVVDNSVHDLRDRAERDVRARLGPDRWDRAYAAGRVSSIDALMKDIDRSLFKSK